MLPDPTLLQPAAEDTQRRGADLSGLADAAVGTAEVTADLLLAAAEAGTGFIGAVGELLGAVVGGVFSSLG